MNNSTQSVRGSIANKLLRNWIFVHYCGQVIGQWQKKYVPNGVINALIAQIGLSTLAFPVYCFLLIGGTSPSAGAAFVMIYVLALYIFLKKPFLKLIDWHKLEHTYQHTSRLRRILYFILALLMILISIPISIYSIKMIATI
jgi:Ca2+/Na+ antiporter